MLANRLRRPDPVLAELERVYRLRFREYAGLAGAILRDVDGGRDATQDAFAQAVRARRSFRGDGPLEAWLWRLVVNAALGERRRRRPAADLDAADQSPAPPAEERRDDIRGAIDRLPERQRLIVFLRYYADLDYRTIADTLAIAPGTVAAALHAAHASLREQLTEEVPT
jgi:RNA polymerase sigma-70 factor (ECF subfamily)